MWKRPRSRPDLRRVGLLAAVMVLAWSASAIAQEGLPAEDAALLLSGQTGGALPIHLAALPLQSAEGGVETRVSVELPVAALLSDTEASISLRLAAYVVDDSGALVGTQIVTRTTDPARLATSGASGVRWLLSMRIPGGPVSLRVLVRILGREQFGLQTLALNLAPPASGWFDGTYPMASDEGWVQPDPTESSEAAVAALPVVSSGTSLRLLLVGPGSDQVPDFVMMPEQGGGAPIELKATPEPTASAVSGAAPDTWRQEVVAVDIPEDSSGRYTLRQKGVENAVGHLIVTGSRQAAATWPELLSGTEGTAGSAEAATAPVEAHRVPRRATLRAVREAADALAAAGFDAGEKKMSDTFDTWWREYGSDGLEILIASGMQIGKRLADSDVESLPPMIALTDRLYRSCLSERRFGCSSAARRLTVGLLDVYSNRKGGSRPLAAAAWSGLGGQLLKAGLWRHANALFQRALQLEPNQSASLMSEGELHERLGEYEVARQAYARLVAAHPDRPEARLRLGVQLARLGQERQAIQEFETVAGGDGPDWTRIVAWEEWASVMLANEGPGAEERVLEKALKAFPRSEQLTLQMASLLDRRGRGAEASRLVASLGEPTGDRSPRNIYTDWPLAELDAAHDEFQRGAQARVPALRQALREAGI